MAMVPLLTKDQFREILLNPDITHQRDIEVLNAFHTYKDHKARPTQVSMRFGDFGNSRQTALNLQIGNHYCKRIIRHFSLEEIPDKFRFELLFDYTKEDGFVYWKLKDNLMEAMKETILPDDQKLGNRGGIVSSWTINKEILKSLIRLYKIDFGQHRKYELYKWKAIKQFQDTWGTVDGVPANAFPSKLRTALSLTDNLLDVNHEFARTRILELAEAEPVTVQAMFQDLFDEKNDVLRRILTFYDKANELIQLHPISGNKPYKHDQTPKAISTYLWLMYPDRHYIYNPTAFEQSARVVVDGNLRFGNDKFCKMMSAFTFYDAFREEIVKDKELLALSEDSLTDQCWPDGHQRTLVTDMTYVFKYYGYYDYLSRAVDELLDYKTQEETNDSLDRSPLDDDIQAESDKSEAAIRPKERTRPVRTQSGLVYPRNSMESTKAIRRARFLCEADQNHKVFLRKKGKYGYTEAHHIIPMAFQDQFEHSLDVWPNIVSLCSDCHNRLHHGAKSEFQEILETLYRQRSEKLDEAGISISYERLMKYYS